MTTPAPDISSLLDQLRGEMLKVIKERNQYRLALEIIRDSFWSENEPFEERVEFLQQSAKDILETVQKERSE